MNIYVDSYDNPDNPLLQFRWHIFCSIAIYEVYITDNTDNPDDLDSPDNPEPLYMFMSVYSHNNFTYHIWLLK